MKEHRLGKCAKAVCFYMKYLLLFCDSSVGAGYGVVSVIVVPIVALAYIAPLFLSAAVVDAREVATMKERRIADACYAVGDCHARKTCAIIEHTLADARYAVGDYHAREACAIIERTITDARYAVGDDHACKAFAIGERIMKNVFGTFIDLAC